MRTTRSSIIALTLFASFASAGCEDGPNDPYQPAPGGAGSVWNDGTGTTTVVPDAGQSFDAATGGQNANDICTAEQVKAARSKYFTAPVLPPGLAAGIDIAGGAKGDGVSGYDPTKTFTYDPGSESWTGVTVEQVEKILCQGTADSIYYGVTTTLGWGDANEFSVMYNSSNRQVTDLLIQVGYEGAVEADNKSTNTHYELNFKNQPIQKSVAGGAAQSMLIDWSDDVALHATANEVYEAFRQTFIPAFPGETDCVSSGHCIIGNNLTQGGYFWFTPMNLAAFVNDTTATQPAASTFTLVDLGKLKVMAYSNAAVTMKLDPGGEGPVGLANGIGDGKNCKFVLGMNFKDFHDNCVAPFSDPTKNKVEEAKLYGSMGHGDETYRFDVQGLDAQFTATLADDKEVADGEKPTDTDTLYEFIVDQEVLGALANDYVDNDATKAKDYHGSGLLTLEWANLVQQHMKDYFGVTADLGDPDCIANPSRSGNSGKVCSGIEGVFTAAPPSAVPANSQLLANAAGPSAADPNQTPYATYIGQGFKPGTWYGAYCRDAGGVDGSGNLVGYQHCPRPAINGGPAPDRYYFSLMQYQIQAAWDDGTPLPKELSNRRTYFKYWMFSLIKYLQSAANPHATLAQIDANPISEDNIFFDSAGGGFEISEYADRTTVNVGNGLPPTAVRVTTNLTTSVIDDFEFVRHNFRGEQALYQALTTNPTDKPGAEAQLISNMVGSPVLQSVFGSYECATNLDPANANCPGLGPTDAAGVPIYKDYKGAFGHSLFNIAPLNAAPTTSPIIVNPNGYEFMQAAMVTVPRWSDPYDPSTASSSDPTIKVLIPYLPKGASVGFPVSIDGSRDKFYNTFNLDFTGETVQANVDYDYVDDADPSKGIIVRAVETQDFLGQVFACADSATGDILSVRMYSPAQDVLDWFAQHPQAFSDCDVVYKYSIYGNYPDYITSRANGIRLAINPGFGGGVISDVTIFDANVVAGLGE